MLTLDEVIKNFEICRKARGNIRGCDGCTYADDADVACIMHNESDVLYYLNEYRNSKATLGNAMERYTQATLWHMDEANKLSAQNFVMEYDNPPLTWDELKQMVGKPVWVELNSEYGNYSHWGIIHSFPKAGYEFMELLGFHDIVSFSVMQKEQGKTWQAYRKERKSDTSRSN